MPVFREVFVEVFIEVFIHADRNCNGCGGAAGSVNRQTP